MLRGFEFELKLADPIAARDATIARLELGISPQKPFVLAFRYRDKAQRRAFELDRRIRTAKLHQAHALVGREAGAALQDAREMPLVDRKLGADKFVRELRELDRQTHGVEFVIAHIHKLIGSGLHLPRLSKYGPFALLHVCSPILWF